MRKIKYFARLTLVVIILVTFTEVLNAQSNWTASGSAITTTSNNPLGYPFGVSVNNNFTGDWAREFSFTYNSTGKLFSFGAFANNGSLNYGYIGGNSIGGTVQTSPWMIFKPNGQIGIGVNPVLAKLHVSNNESSVQLRLERSGSSVGSSDIGTDAEGLKFWPGGFPLNNSPQFLIKTNGQIGIGTTYIPSGYKLAVDGNVIATEINVRLRPNWPDYVFSNSYCLTPLSEVESYIKENKHLPEIPSAAEVEKNGVNVGEMEALLLKKIEELTLYVIEMKKTDEELKLQNDLLKKEILQLKKKRIGQIFKK